MTSLSHKKTHYRRHMSSKRSTRHRRRRHSRLLLLQQNGGAVNAEVDKVLSMPLNRNTPNYVMAKTLVQDVQKGKETSKYLDNEESLVFVIDNVEGPTQDFYIIDDQNIPQYVLLDDSIKGRMGATLNAAAKSASQTMSNTVSNVYKSFQSKETRLQEIKNSNSPTKFSESIALFYPPNQDATKLLNEINTLMQTTGPNAGWNKDMKDNLMGAFNFIGDPDIKCLNQIISVDGEESRLLQIKQKDPCTFDGSIQKAADNIQKFTPPPNSENTQTDAVNIENAYRFIYFMLKLKTMGVLPLTQANKKTNAQAPSTSSVSSLTENSEFPPKEN